MNRQDTVLSMPFVKLYALLVQKAMKKGRTREEVDTVTCWLTGYPPEELKNAEDVYKRQVHHVPDRHISQCPITGLPAILSGCFLSLHP